MSDPYTEKLAELVRRVYRQTASGHLRWTDDELPGDAFATKVNNRKLTIKLVNYENDGDPTQDVEISIYSPSDKKIESVRDTTLITSYMDIDGFSGWFSLMLSVYETARRQINGSEDAVDDILNSLDDTPY